MRTKFKLILAVLSLAILLPLGAFAASQNADTDYDHTTVNLGSDLSTIHAIQRVEDYLRLIYGNELTVWEDHLPGDTPMKVFKYPHRDDATSKTIHKNVVRLLNEEDSQGSTSTPDPNKKIVKGDGTTENPRVCHSLFPYYFYSGKPLDGCGPQGDEVRYSDLSVFGMDNRASSFFEDKTSGNVDMYDNTGFSGFIDTVYSDTAIFGGYLNDKASSAIFSL